MGLAKLVALGAVTIAPFAACSSVTVAGGESESMQTSSKVNVLTRQYSADRAGANLQETTLTVDAVRASANRFHKLFSLPVDEKIETFPLFVSNVPGVGKNLVFITTMNNSVFAFDADTGAKVWQQSLGKAVHNPELAVVKPTSVNKNYGIAATPVIDTDTNTMYVVRWGYENNGKDPVQRLFILSLTDGEEQRPSLRIDAKVDVHHSNGSVSTTSFNHRGQIIRASLLLVRKPHPGKPDDKAVVIAAAGGEGATSPHGWIIAYDVAQLQSSTAARVPAVWCSSPKSGAAGIWMAGQGPSSDGLGNIFFATGNGGFDGVTEFGESFVKLAYTPPGSGSDASLAQIDSFTPFRDGDRDANHQDQDLGSASPLLLPGTNILAGGGKDGILYVMNRDAMGKRDFTKLLQKPFTATYLPTPGTDPVKNLDIISSHDPPRSSQVDGGKIHHFHSTPVFWESPNQGPLLFIWGENARLRALSFNGQTFDPKPAAFGVALPSVTTGGVGGMPGGSISVSSNGQNAGTGIVWGMHAINGDANKFVVAAIVRAYDASNFAIKPDGTKEIVEVWNSEMDPNDTLGNGTKIVAPMVANGKVYVATYDNRVQVYGLTR